MTTIISRFRETIILSCWDVPKAHLTPTIEDLCLLINIGSVRLGYVFWHLCMTFSNLINNPKAVPVSRHQYAIIKVKLCINFNYEANIQYEGLLNGQTFHPPTLFCNYF